jgi:CheY-like chemotaxis protein
MIGTPQLLISDDDRDFRETLRSVFERRGLSTILAADGAEAVQIVREESIHVVLIDMHMPKLTGLEAIRKIKEIQITVPCILISAALDDELREQAEDAFSLLEKPVNFQIVSNVVHAALKSTYGWHGID